MVHFKIFQILLIISSLSYLKALTYPDDDLSTKCLGPNYEPSFGNGLCATDCIFNEGKFKNGEGFHIDKLIEHTSKTNPKTNVPKTKAAIEDCISKLPEYLEKVKKNPGSEDAISKKKCDPKPFALYLCVTAEEEEY